MVLVKCELLKFLKENDKNDDVVYLLNHKDEQYYTINKVRIDTERDIVLDISLSSV
ncbi:MAG: hypothetical protein J6J36_08220 [Clostridia bacterium]|nr:hypothetical protein [Clostridia bacterium]MBP3708559.1 hypothetical protein [Clostridia bacterium]